MFECRHVCTKKIAKHHPVYLRSRGGLDSCGDILGAWTTQVIHWSGYFRVSASITRERRVPRFRSLGAWPLRLQLIGLLTRATIAVCTRELPRLAHYKNCGGGGVSLEHALVGVHDSSFPPGVRRVSRVIFVSRATLRVLLEKGVTPRRGDLEP